MVNVWLGPDKASRVVWDWMALQDFPRCEEPGDEAELLGYWHNGESGLFMVCESLYKADGGYVLVGEGGAGTEYCRYLGDDRTGPGKRAYSLPRAEARRWGRVNMDEDAYYREFGQ